MLSRRLASEKVSRTERFFRRVVTVFLREKMKRGVSRKKIAERKIARENSRKKRMGPIDGLRFQGGEGEVSGTP